MQSSHLLTLTVAISSLELKTTAKLQAYILTIWISRNCLHLLQTKLFLLWLFERKYWIWNIPY